MTDDAMHYVHQLKEKLQQAGGSIRDSASRAGIARTSLELKHGHRANFEGKLQERLAAVLGFETSWPEWRDPQADRNTPDTRRRDTAASFIGRFRHGPPLRTRTRRPRMPGLEIRQLPDRQPRRTIRGPSVRPVRPARRSQLRPDRRRRRHGRRPQDLRPRVRAARARAGAAGRCWTGERGSVVMAARGTARRPFLRYATAAPPIRERLPPWRPLRITRARRPATRSRSR